MQRLYTTSSTTRRDTELWAVSPISGAGNPGLAPERGLEPWVTGGGLGTEAALAGRRGPTLGREPQ